MGRGPSGPEIRYSDRVTKQQPFKLGALPIDRPTLRDAERIVAERRRGLQSFPPSHRDKAAIDLSRQNGDRYRRMAAKANGNLGSQS
jgi:hypothetical protein